MDNGFDRACPSGNIMIDGQNYDPSEEIRLELGDVFKDEDGVLWEVDDIDGETVRVQVLEDQTKYFTKQELVDEMESQQ